MTKFSVGLILLGALSNICGQSAGSQARGSRVSSAVQIYVSDTFGKKLEYELVSFTAIGTAEDFAPRFRDLVGTSIPYGQYSFRLERSGLKECPLAGEAWVSRPRVHLTVTAPPNELCSLNGGILDLARHAREGFVVRGTVQPVPIGPYPAWIIAQPVYDQAALREEATIQPSGEFELYCNGGMYVLTVLQGETALYVAIVSIESAYEGRAQK